MLVSVVEYDCRKTGKFEFIAMGDAHIGSVNHCKKTHKHVVDYIRENNLPWLDVGDCIEAISRRDARFDCDNIDDDICPTVHELKNIIDNQVTAYKNAHKEIRHNCIAILDSNHSNRIKRVEDRDVYGEICDYFTDTDITKSAIHRTKGTLKLGYCGYIVFLLRLTKTTTFKVTVFTHHGYFAGRRQGSKANNIENLMGQHPIAEIVIVGHGHCFVPVYQSVPHVRESYEIATKARIGFMTPSLLRTYNIDAESEGYGGRGGYPFATLGAVKVSIDLNQLRPEKHTGYPYDLTVIT